FVLFRFLSLRLLLALISFPTRRSSDLRQLFWEAELRTVSQGHPDYRFIEQEKYRLVKEKFPLLASFMLVDMNEYAIPRRGTEEQDRKSTRLNSSHEWISYAVFCLKKKR